MDRIKPAKSVDAYFAALDPKSRRALENIRRTVKLAEPKAVEKISYGMPAFYYSGHPLVGLAAFKDHLSFFPMSREVMDLFKDELKLFFNAVGTLHFSAEVPLPASLITKIVKARVNEIDTKK